MSKIDELTKGIKALEDHIKAYPHSLSTPGFKARIEKWKAERAELIGKK